MKNQYPESEQLSCETPAERLTMMDTVQGQINDKDGGVEPRRDNSACSTCHTNIADSDRNRETGNENHRNTGLETRLNMPSLTTDTSSSLKKSSKWTCERIFIVTIAFIFMFMMTMAATVGVYYAINSTTVDTQPVHSDFLRQPNPTASAISQAQNTFGHFNLDIRVDKGKTIWRWIPEKSNNSPSVHVSADNSSIVVRESGLYVIISKITFEFKKDSAVHSLFHNIQIKSPNKKYANVIETNDFTLLRPMYRPIRTKKPSILASIQKLNAGDTIDIKLTSSIWVYPSQSANTLNIIKIVN